MSFIRRPLLASVAMVLGSGIALTCVEASHYNRDGSYYDTKEITLIHIGDIHGHTNTTFEFAQ